MNYYITEELHSGYTSLCQGEQKVMVNDFVVVVDFNDKPVTAKVVKLLNRYDALTSSEKPADIICNVDMKAYNDKRTKELDDKILVDNMQAQISEIQMLEKLEKYAGKSPKIQEMLNAYKGMTELDTPAEEE